MDAAWGTADSAEKQAAIGKTIFDYLKNIFTKDAREYREFQTISQKEMKQR